MLCNGLVTTFAYIVLSTPSAESGPKDLHQWLKQVFVGIPDVREHVFVEISGGPSNDSHSVFGWKVKEGANKIECLSTIGEDMSFPTPTSNEKRPSVAKKDGKVDRNTPSDAYRRMAWSVRPADFVAFARKFIKDGPTSDEEYQEIKAKSLWLPPRKVVAETHAIGAARLALFAFNLGHKELGRDLYAQGAASLKKYAAAHPDEFDKPAEIHLVVAENEALTHRRNAITRASEKTDRKELIEIWKTLGAMPDHSFRDEAKEMIRLYGVMLEEDRRWTKLDEKAVEALSDDAKTAYWLHQIRDLKEPWSDSGKREIHDDDQDGSIRFGLFQQSPILAELSKLGMAALPTLIAHLDDRRPIRSRIHSENPSRHDGHLRYGDQCQMLFEQITGYTLHEGFAVRDGKAAECKAKAERWLKDFRKKGEKQILIEAVAMGNLDSSRHAQKLAKEYPEVAFAPIVQGVRVAQNDAVRASMIFSADRLSDPGLVPFLRSELDGPFLRSRIRASRALVARKDAAGFDALMSEWKKLRDQKVDREEFRWAFDEIRQAALSTQKAGVFRMLLEDLPNCNRTARANILWHLPRAHFAFEPERLTKDVIEGVEDLLVAMLDDTEPALTTNSSNDIVTSRWPLLGDEAAVSLLRHWGEEDAFSLVAPLQERIRKKRELKNAVLKSRGKEPVPFAARKIDPTSDETIHPLLRALREATDDAARERSLKSLENLGLAGLPAVHLASQRFESDHPAFPGLKKLAVKLGFIVREVEITVDSQPPNDAVRRLVKDLHGQSLTEPLVMKFLTDLTAALPKDVHGFRFTIDRLPDNTGAYVSVTLCTGEREDANSIPAVRHATRYVRGEKASEGQYPQYFSADAGLNTLNWRDFSSTLRELLAAPPDEYVFAFSWCTESVRQK